MRIDVTTDESVARVGKQLERSADQLGEIDETLVDIKRSLLDIARNYRRALGKGAAIHVADGADVRDDESATDD